MSRLETLFPNDKIYVTKSGLGNKGKLGMSNEQNTQGKRKRGKSETPLQRKAREALGDVEEGRKMRKELASLKEEKKKRR